MASNVERICWTAQLPNNGTSPHVLPNGTSAIADGEVLIESEFLELNSQLHYSKTVHILLTEEFVFVKEVRDGRDSEASSLLQHDSEKTVSKFLRREVAVEVCKGCAFTFKAKWSEDSPVWKTYELCGREEVWVKWLRSFNLEESQDLAMISSSTSVGDSDSDEFSDDEEADEVQMIPEYALTLSVDRTISTWSVSMLNPSKVRRFAFAQHQPLLPSLESSRNDSDLEDMFHNLNSGSIYRSNSHPSISLGKPFRCASLPNIADLGNVRLDTDLRFNSRRTRVQSTAHDFNREEENGDENAVLSTLQQRVENLRAHPSNLNFVRRGKGDEAVWESLTTPRHHRKHSLCLAIGNEANRIPMPSDLSTRGVRNRRVSHKQEIDKHNGKVLHSPHTNSRHSSLSPKRCSTWRSESLPPSKKPELSCSVKSNSERESKSGTPYCSQFQDDMAVDLREADQPPRKEKIKRFWSVLYKKRPKLRAQEIESDDSCKSSDGTIRTNSGNVLSFQDSDSLNRVVAGGRRGGFSDNFAAVKTVALTMEESDTTFQNKQGKW